MRLNRNKILDALPLCKCFGYRPVYNKLIRYRPEIDRKEAAVKSSIKMSREEKNIHKDRKTYPERQTGGTRKSSDFNGSRNFRDQRRAPKRDKNAEQNARRYDSDSEDESCGVIVGRNAVRELLKSGRDIDKIFVRKGDREGSIVVLVATAIERKIPVVEVESQKLDTLAGSGQHQGIVAMAAGKEYSSVPGKIWSDCVFGTGGSDCIRRRLFSIRGS